ncbi:MAG: terminase large subunit [Clostridia bacterium]|nr:terminase large subunit [Clostridia bacterium]
MDRVTEYAKKTIDEAKMGELHILACKRHLEDLKRQGTKSFPYIWNPEQSERILEYAETLTIAEGFELKPVKLLGSQIFDLGCPFGWLKQENGKRRFRRSYESMARQNGKSFKNGIRGTYIANFSGYNFGKLFTVATKKRQARIAWEEMAKFIKTDEDLQELFEIKDYKSLILARDTESTIEALSKESGLDDGFRAIFASIDEYHQHPNAKIYKAIYNGTKALLETLISIITTRGDNLNSACYEMDQYCINILKGIVTAEDFFVDIYALNENDDIFNPKNLIKANPFLASTEQGLETLITDMQTARDMGGNELRDFMTKSLNLWVKNTDDRFINPDKWKKCESDLELQDLAGKKCYVGLDLSHGGDLTTVAIEIPLEDEELFECSHSFMPRGRLQEHIVTDIAPYDVWEQQELITVTGGQDTYKNDYKFIIKYLKEIIENYDLQLQAIGYDPHNADGFLSDLETFGVPLLEIKQSARYLNDGTQDMQLNIESGKIKYNKKEQLLSYSVSNAKIVRNSFGEKKVDKEPNKRTKRIDPVDAMINAHITQMKFNEKEQVNYDKEMEEYLEKMGWDD